MTTIFSPTFAEAVSVFPSAETAAVLPEGALSFYTESNLFFAAVSKDFIRAIEKQEGMEILSEIDKMLGAYKGLSVVSTDSHYAIPFKYTFEGGVFRLYVDRAMMLPYVKLLKDVLGGLGLDPSQMMGLDPAVILDDLFNATTELQIAVYLKKCNSGLCPICGHPERFVPDGFFREPPKNCLCENLPVFFVAGVAYPAGNC